MGTHTFRTIDIQFKLINGNVCFWPFYTSISNHYSFIGIETYFIGWLSTDIPEYPFYLKTIVS